MAAAGLPFQPVDQVDDGVEPAPGSAADAGPGDGNGEMALAGSCATDEDSIALLGKESARCQLVHQCLVDRRAVESEVADILGERQLGDGQLVLDRPRLLLGNLGLEQITDNARRLVLTLDAGRHHLVVGGMPYSLSA